MPSMILLDHMKILLAFILILNGALFAQIFFPSLSPVSCCGQNNVNFYGGVLSLILGVISLIISFFKGDVRLVIFSLLAAVAGFIAMFIFASCCGNNPIF